MVLGPLITARLTFLCACTLRFKLHPVFNEEEFAHWFLPREGVIDSYVKVDNDNQITDFVSFYHLPSTIINNPKHVRVHCLRSGGDCVAVADFEPFAILLALLAKQKTLFAAYSYYNVANTMDLKDLMQSALVLARDRNVDVFNALDLMDNSNVLADLKFGIGDGHLQYYLYNWRCPGIQPNELGLVLL